MKKFEYDVFAITFKHPDHIGHSMNKYGEDGWEVISTLHYEYNPISEKGTVILMAKKELQETWSASSEVRVTLENNENSNG